LFSDFTGGFSFLGERALMCTHCHYNTRLNQKLS